MELKDLAKYKVVAPTQPKVKKELKRHTSGKKKKSTIKVKRGEVYNVNIPPYLTEGSELRGVHPAVIVSNDVGNTHSTNVMVVLVTTGMKASLPTHVSVNCDGLSGIAQCEAITTVSTLRFFEKLGELNPEQMMQVDAAMEVALSKNAKRIGAIARNMNDVNYERLNQYKGDDKLITKTREHVGKMIKLSAELAEIDIQIEKAKSYSENNNLSEYMRRAQMSSTQKQAMHNLEKRKKKVTETIKELLNTSTDEDTKIK